MSGSQAPVDSLPRPDAVELSEFTRQTRALYDRTEAAIAAGKIGSLLESFFSDDAISFGPDAKVIRGRSQLRGMYERVTSSISAIKITSVQAYVNGSLGWEWVNIENTSKDGSKLHVAMLYLWCRTNGLWICGGNAYAESPGKPVAW
jgi:ketosteroid isomerase-like protein